MRATLELLAEIGYRALSMEQVRARAGVGKATIYRRYASKDELVKAAIGHLHHDLPVPDSGSLEGDFLAASANAIGAAEATGAPALVPRLLAEAAHDPELQRIFYDGLVAPRRALLRAVLERGVARGEMRDDVDIELAIDMLAGPLIYRFLIGGEMEALRDRPAAVLAAALRGLA